MPDTPMPTRAPSGWLGFIFGSIALIMTVVVLQAGPFAPQQAAGVNLGELTAEIAKSAAHSIVGAKQPVPARAPWDVDDTLDVVVIALAGIAAILGSAAFCRHETKRVALSGIALGGVSVGIWLFTYWIMAIIGALIVTAIIESLRASFGTNFRGPLSE